MKHIIKDVLLYCIGFALLATVLLFVGGNIYKIFKTTFDPRVEQNVEIIKELKNIHQSIKKLGENK